MNALKWFAVVVALFVGTSAFVAAEEKAKDAPAAKKEKPKTVKLVKPWSLLTSLSDEQKTKIDSIHDAAREEIKKIEAKEKDDIMAVLSDAQKKELEAALEKEKADRKAATEHKKEEPTPKK
jgi:Spy/CpxP family protein refolding chaperone